ncbi:DUF7833 domain-containing protein [Flavobacterium selenitireducens]|uniref:DUF7833 domain-containing protein n=1 Tax=Flavobacterium selenitireducens TaxID=2722704 RepID=UPI00168A53B6|nr:DUF1376 domain-containing protein [Flavobacterium selenitireducens]MBD3582751.1 YdaU family protein [Flavobacterium selenitireducens]
MGKDPAFLFYSKDFYEGTRMMLPEERACYLDLLIYQHQNGGFIPNEPRRLMMYCSGIDEATLKATLEAKFELTEKGWYNKKLQEVVSLRSEFSGKQALNGRVGQFWKKAKLFLSEKEHSQLRENLQHLNNEEIFEKIKDIDIKNKAMLEAMLKHLVNEDVIEDVIVVDKGKGVQGEKPLSRNQAFYNNAIESPEWIETVCMQQRSTPEIIIAKLKDFLLTIEAQTDQKPNEKEFRSHFVNWMTKTANQKPAANGIRPPGQRPYRNV